MDVREGGGSAHVLRVEEPIEAGFIALFDRSNEFATLLSEDRPSGGYFQQIP